MSRDRTTLISLGSNLGDSVSLIRAALERLALLSAEPLVKSSLWQTSPVDCPPGSPPFVNAAAALTVKAQETPESLLAQLQALENEFGRRPKMVLNEPRPLDLDLIAFGNEVRTTSALTLPHPRAHLRRFVLQPLSEIAPEFVLPGHARTISELLAELTSNDHVMRLSESV
jgi:2-amino-4-hydroxy-6-hydroxymethyldihydropteridine diphosphokinase